MGCRGWLVKLRVYMFRQKKTHPTDRDTTSNLHIPEGQVSHLHRPQLLATHRLAAIQRSLFADEQPLLATSDPRSDCCTVVAVLAGSVPDVEKGSRKDALDLCGFARRK